MNIYRQKLVNTILYFARETSHLNLTKLFKLLNFFDFEHFSQTGYPAIGLRYETFKNGPVPRQLWLDLKDGATPEDIGKVISLRVNRHQYGDGHEVEFRARAGAKPELSIFSPREQRLLENLAFIYKDATASQMSEISHEEERPWRITKDNHGLNKEIDYMLALDGESEISEDEARQLLSEYFAVLTEFNLDPMENA